MSGNTQAVEQIIASLQEQVRYLLRTEAGGVSTSATFATPGGASGTITTINGAVTVLTPGGSSSDKVKNITVTDSPYTAPAYDCYIFCNAVGGAITVSLPAASSSAGRRYDIKKTDVSAYVVTIDANASETIDGALTLPINLQYESYTLVCDGATWWIV
jgi:hypothetical protein